MKSDLLFRKKAFHTPITKVLNGQSEKIRSQTGGRKAVNLWRVCVCVPSFEQGNSLRQSLFGNSTLSTILKQYIQYV